MSLRDIDIVGYLDLEATEFQIRSSMHGLGSKLLEELLNAGNSGHQGQTIIYGNGRKAEFKEYRGKKVRTVLGDISVKRAYYYDRTNKTGHCPQDSALDIVGTSFSPGLRRIMSRVGAYRPFALGHEDIKEMVGIQITSKEIERIACQSGEDVNDFFEKKEAGDVIPFPKAATMYVCVDGTGVPVVKSETAGRKGKHKNGEAKTREAKLGCVFTQTNVDKDGYPVRDEASTSYVGAIENAENFGDRIYQEGKRRGIENAKRTCVIGDGALWIWNLADLHFYGAIQIVDLYHAREHCWKIGKEILGSDKEKMRVWVKARIKELDQGEIEKLIVALGNLSPATEAGKESVQNKINYFDKNKERMRYKKFREQGLFVGSGVIEAGCRAVIGQRLKQSGMHWTVNHANNIIALRCCMFSNRWEDFWESRANAA